MILASRPTADLNAASKPKRCLRSRFTLLAAVIAVAASAPSASAGLISIGVTTLSSDGDQILNPGGLRMEREFVKHKALDAIGDLYVLGAPLLGRYEGVKAGHHINNLLVRELLANPQAWREVTRVPEMAMAG